MANRNCKFMNLRLIHKMCIKSGEDLSDFHRRVRCVFRQTAIGKRCGILQRGVLRAFHLNHIEEKTSRLHAICMSTCHPDRFHSARACVGEPIDVFQSASKRYLGWRPTIQQPSDANDGYNLAWPAGRRMSRDSYQ